jgi:hypothetical protein
MFLDRGSCVVLTRKRNSYYFLTVSLIPTSRQTPRHDRAEASTWGSWDKHIVPVRIRPTETDREADTRQSSDRQRPTEVQQRTIVNRQSLDTESRQSPDCRHATQSPDRAARLRDTHTDVHGNTAHATAAALSPTRDRPWTDRDTTATPGAGLSASACSDERYTNMI